MCKQISLASLFLFASVSWVWGANPKDCPSPADTIEIATIHFKNKFETLWQWTPSQKNTRSAPADFSDEHLIGHEAFILITEKQTPKVIKGVIMQADARSWHVKLKSGKFKRIEPAQVRRVALSLPRMARVEEFTTRYGSHQPLKPLPQSEHLVVSSQGANLGKDKRVALYVKRGEHTFIVEGSIRSNLTYSKKGDAVLWHDSITIRGEGSEVDQKYHVTEIQQMRLLE